MEQTREEYSSMTLLHAGANPVTYDELRAISTPEPTASHVPIPHHEVVELMRYTLGFYGHEVIEEHHGITPDGNRYFGVLTLRSQYGEYSDMLGLRNSHDRSLPIGIAFGARVMVCDNLSMLADHVIKRKHTVKAKRELPGLIQEIIQPLQAQRLGQNQRLVAYQQTPLTDEQADHAILEMYRKDVINLQRIGAVVNAWENPPHAWGDRTAWRLFNAATYTLEGRVTEKPQLTQQLHSVIDGVCQTIH
jgi:hypothetical protein